MSKRRSLDLEEWSAVRRGELEGLSFPYSIFSFPNGSFQSASAMLALGERLESIFIGVYLGAIKAAAQVLGIECEHRALIREVAGDSEPNNRVFEGNLSPRTARPSTPQRETP